MVRPTDRPANNNRRVWARVLGSQRSSDIAVVVYIRSPLLRLPVLFPWSTSWSRGRPDLRWASYTLSLSLSLLSPPRRRPVVSSPLSLSPSVPVVIQISQAAFILRLSDILYSLSLLGPPLLLLDTRVPYVMKRGPAPCRDALQEANGVREGPRVPSLTYWTVYTPCVFMAPDYTCLSLSLSHSFTIYIVYQATRIVEWCSPPSDGDKPKRYNAYEARDTNNTKGSAPRTRDHGSRVEIFREDSVRFATQRGGRGGLFSIAWNRREGGDEWGGG